MPHLHLSKIALAISVFLYPQLSIAAPTETNNKSDDIIISASKVETKRIETGSAITVIDEAYIEQNQSRSVAEILRDVAGVHVATNGGLGKKSSVFIRGAASENTVVIIDGVKVSDRSSSNGGFDLANLMTDSIERIEVLRGPQSAIWGSDAMGGVINIVTKKGKGTFNMSLDVEGGSHYYHKEVLNVNGASTNSHYSVTVANIDTDGISTKTGEFDDPDDDAYSNQNITIKAGYQFTPIFSMDAIFNHTDSVSEYDNIYDMTHPEKNHVYGEYRQQLAKINSYLNLLDESLKNRFSVSYSNSRSENFDPNYWSGDVYTKNSGENAKAELQSDYLFSRGNFENRMTLVGEVEASTFQAWGDFEEEEMRNTAVIAELATNWTNTIFATASFRQDFNDKFDDTNTYKLAISGWVSEGIRLHSSYGTGVKNPTFSQLFGDYSTPNLNPESSKGWDAGIEYNFASVDGYIDLTYFDATYIDAIRWDPTVGAWGGYVNQDEESTGVELSGLVHLHADLRLNGQYTYMQTSDGTAAGNALLRRPEHSASINTNYAVTQKWHVNAGARYVGDRLDYGSPSSIHLDSYTVFNLASSYQIHERVSVYSRIENLFDNNYVDVTDYGTEGLTAYVGITIK